VNKYDYEREENQAVALPRTNCPRCGIPVVIEWERDWDGPIYECFCDDCEIRWWVDFE